MTDVGDDFFGPQVRFKGGGLVLRELMDELGAEFTLEASQSDATESEKDLRIEQCYKFEDFAPYINLDCVNLDTEEITNSSPFDALKKKMTNILADGKIYKRTMRTGSGDVIPRNGVVYFHYNSYLEMEEVPFDSSYLRSQAPIRSQLGQGNMYSGFEMCLFSMKVGEKSQFLVHPDYAYGKMGAPPRIPPNATLLLDIELFKTVDCGGIHDIDLPQEERQKFSVVINKAKAFHLLGNDHFEQKNIHLAVDNYRKAENCLLSCKLANDEEEMEYKKLLLKVYTNICICFNHPKLKQPEKVCIAAREAFYTAPREAARSAKLYFNLGKAQMALNDWNKAEKTLKKALSLEPQGSAVCQLLLLLEKKKKAYYQHEKISYQKAFGFNKSCSTEEKKADPKEDADTLKKFEEELKIQLNEFLEGCTKVIALPLGLTCQEKTVCAKVAEDLGLIYTEEMIAGRLKLSIHK